jgi:beta-lactamase superfamily II metal-dependent hydrolase
MRPNLPALAAALFLVLPGLLAAVSKPGDIFPPWSEGLLDIHHINTGRGESSLVIMPDGTAMLVDAGSTSYEPPWAGEALPNATRAPGEWIARYAARMLADAPAKRLHYVLLSHFHEDHMGSPSKASRAKDAPAGGYKFVGVTEVPEHIPCEVFIDRGWPDYDWPEPIKDAKMDNYRKFLDWQVKNKGLRVERFRPGAADQIVLRNNPAKYPGFRVRNIAANGRVWTGVGSVTRNHLPAPADLRGQTLSENKLSIAFRVSLGAFDYYSGGDLDVRGADTASTGDAWRDIEWPVALATGPVEVAKANHHGNYDANSAAFLGILRPRVIVIDAWSASQPAFNVFRRMKSPATYPGPRDIFATHSSESNLLAIRAQEKELPHGHIVIRTAPGGGEYHVYVLRDTDESFQVKSAHGPYQSENPRPAAATTAQRKP